MTTPTKKTDRSLQCPPCPSKLRELTHSSPETEVFCFDDHPDTSTPDSKLRTVFKRKQRGLMYSKLKSANFKIKMIKERLEQLSECMEAFTNCVEYRISTFSTTMFVSNHRELITDMELDGNELERELHVVNTTIQSLLDI